MSEEFLFPLGEARQRMDGGDTFGLSRSVYSRMCWCGIMVCDHSDVEPITFKRLPGGGCDLIFYGKENAYTIRATEERCALSLLPLDSHSEQPVEVFCGKSEWREDWDRLAQIFLQHEGIAFVTEEDLRDLGQSAEF